MISKWKIALCAAVFCVAFNTHGARATDGFDIRVVRSGIAYNVKLGRGVLIHVVLSPMPKDGLRNAAVQKFMGELCQFYTRHAVPDIAAAANLDVAKIPYLLIEVAEKEAALWVGFSQAYRIRDGQCLEKL